MAVWQRCFSPDTEKNKESPMETHNERREARRYPVKGGAFVNFKKKSFFLLNRYEYIQIGPVSDISCKGMSVYYFSKKNSCDEGLGLAILNLSGKVILDDLMFETIYDVEIGELPDGKKIRKRALRFNDISGYQAAWLSCLIHNLSSRQAELARPSSNDERPDLLKEVF